MLESLTDIAHQSGPLSLLLLLIACSFGLPLAKSLIIVAAGVLAGTGSQHPVAWFLASALGLHLGDFALYLIGRKWGEQAFEWKPLKRLVPTQYLAKARDLIQRYGVASLLFARITPFVRSACYMLLGTLRMDAVKFNLVNLGVSIVYASVFFFLGFFLGNRPETLRSWASSWHIILAVILFITALICLRYSHVSGNQLHRAKARFRNSK